jgi:hypothetical protein
MAGKKWHFGWGKSSVYLLAMTDGKGRKIHEF